MIFALIPFMMVAAIHGETLLNPWRRFPFAPERVWQ
jgi:hypothetical protein